MADRAVLAKVRSPLHSREAGARIPSLRIALAPSEFIIGTSLASRAVDHVYAYCDCLSLGLNGHTMSGSDAAEVFVAAGSAEHVVDYALTRFRSTDG